MRRSAVMWMALAVWPVLPAHAGQGAAPGAEAEAPVPVIEVQGLTDPDAHSYRKMVRGMDAFEKYRRLAPAGQLRYRLIPRLPGVRAEGVTVTVQGAHVTLPVPLDADLAFTLPRDAQAWDDWARVVTNRKDRSFAWTPDVRTPGLPANVRRLGDLRLECEIDREASLVSGYKPPSYLLLAAATDVCTTFPSGQWLYYADRPIFNVTLVHGRRRQPVPAAKMYGAFIPKLFWPFYDFQPHLLDRTFALKISDTSWPDDTLVEFDYMDDPDPVPATVPKSAGGPAATAPEAPR